jgi:hypothetical protein
MLPANDNKPRRNYLLEGSPGGLAESLRRANEYLAKTGQMTAELEGKTAALKRRFGLDGVSDGEVSI